MYNISDLKDKSKIYNDSTNKNESGSESESSSDEEIAGNFSMFPMDKFDTGVKRVQEYSSVYQEEKSTEKKKVKLDSSREEL
ncbi:hypothetical protein AYI70_g5374 [Smittium culicis]|uniref:Uncharacterized protein n=1 Tax=Smittium culicis TaxID=133412 RepID=A0A1R1XUV9_9FUNG|nr:hypothetical protein AYI70_g5374 [Smittium culicis]